MTLRALWRKLPAPLRARAWNYLAEHNIGVLPPPPPPAAPGHLGAILDAPTEMSLEERLFLYTLVRGFAPERVLEIGTSQGGSAAIIAAALEDNGRGRVAGIDPLPRIELPQEAYHGRFSLISGFSPQVIPQAVAALGGSVDLLLVDGVHIYRQAAIDVEATLPHLSESAYILFHDAFHFGVSEAIRESVERHPQLHDCGYVCSRPRPVGDLLTHAGFRLVRVGAPVVDIEPLVAEVWSEAGKRPPHDPDLRNHDVWYCAMVEPCEYCSRQGNGAAGQPDRSRP